MVGPGEELVHHPRQHADGGVVQREAEGAGFGILDHEIGETKGGEVVLLGYGAGFEGCVCWLCGEVGLWHCYLSGRSVLGRWGLSR